VAASTRVQGWRYVVFLDTHTGKKLPIKTGKNSKMYSGCNFVVFDEARIGQRHTSLVLQAPNSKPFGYIDVNI
jgi:hypothetical protein